MLSFMSLGKILDHIAQDGNISKEMIFQIVNQVKNADLSDERVLRKLIRDIGKIANRPVSRELEDQLVKKIKEDGVPSDLGGFF